MSIETVALDSNFIVTIVLVLRLVWLRLFDKYKVFGALLLYEALMTLARYTLHVFAIDYRVLWLGTRPIAWVLYVWVVYSILNRVMGDHRGLLSISKRVVLWSFVGAVVIAVTTARIEYVVTAHHDADLMAMLVERAFVIERAVVTTSLLLLAVTLTFLLWFPVQVSRNVAILCSGLLVYFAAETTLLLFRDVWSRESLRIVSTALMLVHSGCLVLWSFLNNAGEALTVRPGHSWKPREQERLIGQLEAINAVLLRTAKRT